MIRIERNAIDRAYFYTLRCFVMADTFGTQIRIDDIDLIAWADRIIRTFWFADITINTLISNH